PSKGGPCRGDLQEGPMSNALTLSDMSPGLVKVVGRAPTSHLGGRAGCGKSARPDLARGRDGLPPGLLYKPLFTQSYPPPSAHPPPATALPLVPALGAGPHGPRCPPGAGLARAYRRRPTPAAGQPCRPPAGHRPAPPGTARTGGWGRAAGAAGAAERCLQAAGAARGGLLGLGLIQTR